MAKVVDFDLLEIQDCSNNIDVDEIFGYFMPALSSQLSDEEIALRNEIKLFKQAKKILSDLNLEISAQRVKPDVQQRPCRSTEEAKEEAMKLLKSGAISLPPSSVPDTFKRKVRGKVYNETDESPDLGKEKRFNLYDNFVSGEIMNPPLAPSPIKRKLSDSPPDSSLETPSTFVFGTANLATLRSPPPSGRLEQGREDRKYDGSTIYISFSDINESAVREILEPYGPILNIHLDENKCYAFVTLTSEEMAEKALKLDKSKYQNHRLRVNFARRNRQQSRDGNVDVGPTHQTPRPPSWGGPRKFHRVEPRSPPNRGTLPGPEHLSTSPSNRNLISYSDID
uniref:Negative elongation factor E n=1 Tax=Mesocestoides corti TaxID=53468 RepID=A0A5K3EI63_MESCO